MLAPRLLWLEAAVVPVVYLLANYFRKNIFAAEKRVRACVAAIYIFIQEWLKGIRTVKVYGMEGQGERKFAEPLRAHLAAINATSLYDSWFPCVMQTLRAVIIAIALFLGAKNGTVLSLGLSVGTLAAMVDLVGKLFAPLEALATEFQTMQEAMAGLERVREFANQPIEARKQTEQTADMSRGIDIEDVSFAYDDGLPVLQHISVNIACGEKAVFIGRSGAGKTTLMNIVAGLYACSEGGIRICGVDPYTLPTAQRRRLLGIVPQMPQIFDSTIYENITLRDDAISEQEVVGRSQNSGAARGYYAAPAAVSDCHRGRCGWAKQRRDTASFSCARDRKPTRGYCCWMSRLPGWIPKQNRCFLPPYAKPGQGAHHTFHQPSCERHY